MSRLEEMDGYAEELGDEAAAEIAERRERLDNLEKAINNLPDTGQMLEIRLILRELVRLIA
jgi:hypothetical protein